MATIKHCQITSAQAETIVAALHTHGYPVNATAASTNFGSLAIECAGELITLEEIQAGMTATDDETHFMHIKDGTLAATTLSSLNHLFEVLASAAVWDKDLDFHVISL